LSGEFVDVDVDLDDDVDEFPGCGDCWQNKPPSL